MNQQELCEIQFRLSRGHTIVRQVRTVQLSGAVLAHISGGLTTMVTVYLAPDQADPVTTAANLVGSKDWVDPVARILCKHAADMRTFGPRYCLQQWPGVVDELRETAESGDDSLLEAFQKAGQLVTVENLLAVADRLETWYQQWQRAMA